MWSGSREIPYLRKLCIHVYRTSTVREVVVVFDFSSLVEKVMNELGQVWRWRLMEW